MRNSPPHVKSLVSPTTYRILREALTYNRPFTESGLAERAEASRAQVSRVVRWLMARGAAERLHTGDYVVRGAVGVAVGAIPTQRTMSDALALSVKLRGNISSTKEEVLKVGGILCLETALAEYSQFYRPSRVCAYHASPESALEKLRSLGGGNVPLELYLPDIPLAGDVVAGRMTSKFRTIVDLACDNRVYAARDLLRELWGVEIE